MLDSLASGKQQQKEMRFEMVDKGLVVETMVE
jgi:hypothetical protein